MNCRLLMLDGDGVGPEIVSATRTVLEQISARYALGIEFTQAQIGFAALQTDGVTISESTIEAARAADGIVLGPVSHNEYPAVEAGGLNPSGMLRKQLDLFANIRPARTPAGRPPDRPIDLVVVRENTEGFYADRNLYMGPGEFMPDPDTALALRKISRKACRRIAEQAFIIANQRPARHVTSVHKANVLRISDGLFLEETRAVACQWPDITYDEMLVDAMAAHLVREPERFDVLVSTNMYGDILSDLAAEISGSLGLAASLNHSAEHAMAQEQHGSAPDIAGQGIANPASLIASAAMLLRWLAARDDKPGLMEAANHIEQALEGALSTPTCLTPDLGGAAGTGDFVAEVCRRLGTD